MGDMRGERTKELLRETMRAILQVKPLEKVTVKEVLDGASVSKKAFYNHYADIYDLAVDAHLVPPERYRFEYKPFDEYANMVELCGDVLTSVARGLEFERAHPNLARAVSFIDKDVCARYVFNGATGVIREWMRTGMEQDSESLAKQCVAFNLQCISLMAGHGIDPEVLAFIENWHFEGC